MRKAKPRGSTFLQAAVVIVQQSAHERADFGMIESGRSLR
jgi:hypothetical protein